MPSTVKPLPQKVDPKDPEGSGYLRVSDLPDHTGATYRQIDYWVTTGSVEVYSTGEGKGYPRFVTDAEAEIVRLAARLVKSLGTSPAPAILLARRLQQGPVTLGPVMLSLAETEVNP